MLRLFYMTGACSVIPHIVLEEIGVDYEAVLVDFHNGDRGNPELFPHIRAHRQRMLQRPAVRQTLELEGLPEVW